MARRVLKLLSPGAYFHTDYISVDMPREGFETLLEALCGVCKADLPRVMWVKSNDSGVPQRNVLQALSTKNDRGSACVFGNVNDYLQPETVELVEKMVPDKNAS
eukprot:5133091-Alexandrium_andersonii.AAC.1